MSQDFQQIANSVLNKGKSAIPPQFNGPEVSLGARGPEVSPLFNGPEVSPEVSLNPFFSSRTNLKLHISVTPKGGKVYN